MATQRTNDFLRFSAYSIKDLITRKLSEDAKFTDQVYEGSNLAILIDIVSYMYQCLIYNLNNAASESMFSDTQIYENISRLCRFIGYHPQGFKPAQLNMYIVKNSIMSDAINANENIKWQVYPCTAFDTGMYDSNGKKIYFSTIFDHNNDSQPIAITDADAITHVSLTNGKWSHYATVFTATGSDYETFVLDGLKSDSNEQCFIADNKIQVFVEDTSGNVVRWDCDPNEIFIQAYDSSKFAPQDPNGTIFSKLYNEQSLVYTAYLNENKTYEIKFGNGILGKKLTPGDKIHVMYLDTNGPDGYIDLSQIQSMQQENVKLQHSPSFFGVDIALYKKMFSINEEYHIDDDNISNATCTVQIDPNSLTHIQYEENVESIRENAPQWFKTGNRLITKKDYEYFVTSNRNSMFTGVIDAKCMNNWDYMTTFYRWLYNIALNPIEYAKSNDGKQDPYKYLSRSRLIQAGYQYVDAADANNIYLWIATSKEDDDIMTLKKQLNTSISQIKTMTSETYPLSPINVYFDLSFTPLELYYTMMQQNISANKIESEFDKDLSYLEITIADNSIYSTTQLLNSIASIIEDSFLPSKCHIGQIINYDTILEKIYVINGVERVRTVYYPVDYLSESSTAAERYSKYKTRACDGISFASWSHTSLINIGDDLQINNTNRTLEQFQFPRLVPGFNIKNKIKIIKKSMNTTSPIKF